MHLAGIIPVSQLVTDHESITPDVLTLLEPRFTAIQNAVMACAMAGCKTIWIVANNDLAPIVKQAVGEWVHDPVYYKREFTKFYSNVRKEVPIYYVPIHPKDLDRRDSYGWSVLHGIYSSWFVSYKISRWILPEKYFIAFPMSVYDYRILRELRPQIQDANKNFTLTYDNKSKKQNSVPCHCWYTNWWFWFYKGVSLSISLVFNGLLLCGDENILQVSIQSLPFVTTFSFAALRCISKCFAELFFISYE